MGARLALREGATCVVAGAYKGKVVDLLYHLYQPARIVGYEPQDWAFFMAKGRVGDLPGVELHRYGIGVEFGVFPMGEWGTDGCSFVNVGSREQGEGLVAEIGKEFDQRGLDEIDFFLMNMEGYEYSLLPHMCATGVIRRVALLAAQFHLNLQNYSALAEANMFRDLLATHRLVEDDYPRWQLWERR